MENRIRSNQVLFVKYVEENNYNELMKRIIEEKRHMKKDYWATSTREFMKKVKLSVKAPLANSRINWVYDSPPSQSHHIAPRQTPPKSNNKVPRNNDNVPRNRPIAQSSDVRMRAPLGNISRSVWHNSTLSFRSNNCPPVPRNNMTDRQVDPQKTVSPTPKRKRNRYYRRERRAIERAERGEMFIHDAQWATQSSGAPSSTLVPDRLTESGSRTMG